MLQRVAGSTLYEKIVWQIKNQIAQGIYKKGDRLPSEKEIMDMTGVSRVTVREALRILASVGIIETRKGKGSFVIVDSDNQTISELFHSNIGEYRENFIYASRIRLMIEPEIAKNAALLSTEEDIRELSALLDESDNPMADLEAFHRRIFIIVDSSALLAFFDSLTAIENTQPKIDLVSPLLDNLANMAAIKEQHARILKAISEKNPEFAYFYMKEHLTFIIRVHEEYFSYFF